MLRIWSVFVLLLAAAPALAGPQGRIHVIDGDTFDVGGTRVRLHGVDAPESKQTCQTEQGVAWGCGQWVNAQVRGLFEGKRARCTAVDTDRYGRVVAKCAVNGVDMGEEIVASGLAFAYRKYSWDYDLTEKQAAVADRGLHASRVQTPAQYRKTRTKGAHSAGRMPDQGQYLEIGPNLSHAGARALRAHRYQRTQRRAVVLHRGRGRAGRMAARAALICAPLRRGGGGSGRGASRCGC